MEYPNKFVKNSHKPLSILPIGIFQIQIKRRRKKKKHFRANFLLFIQKNSRNSAPRYHWTSFHRNIHVYITTQSPSCCFWLRDIRSLGRAFSLPDRFRSSNRSLALGKSCAIITLDVSMNSLMPHEENIKEKKKKKRQCREMKTYRLLSNTIAWHPPCLLERRCPPP